MPRPFRFLRHPLLPALLGVGVVLFFTNAYPLVQLLRRAFAGAEGVTFENLQWLLTNRRVRTALTNSLTVSGVATLLALPLGTLLALVTRRTDLPGRGLFGGLFLAPLIIPPQVLALAYLQWAGPVGYVQTLARSVLGLETRISLYGQGGVTLLLMLFVLPVVYLTLSAGLAGLSREIEEAARLDGASGFGVWRRVLLPLLLPHLFAAALLAFLGALGNFGIPALLAIPARYSTLPTLLYSEVIAFSSGGLGHAAALALLFGLPAIVALALQGRLTRDDGGLERGAPGLVLKLGRWRWLLALGMLFLSALLIVGPLFALVATSLIRAYGLPLRLENLTLEHYRFVLFSLERARRATVHSFSLAAGAAIVCAGLASILGYAFVRLRGRYLWVLRLVVDLPYALPGLIFALSLILVWLPSPIPGVQLYGTLWLLFFAYVGRFLAFALQPVGAAWRGLEKSYEEAAQLDGATLGQTLVYVLLPLIAPSLGAAVMLVFLQALGELTLSALLAGSGTETLGWLVFGLEQGGSSPQAAALSMLLLTAIFTAAALAGLLARLARRNKETNL